MKIFNREKGDGELFEIDDELKRKLDDMSNADEVVDLMDTLGEHEDAINEAIETVEVLRKSGMFDIVQRLGSVTDDELDNPPRVGPLDAARQLRDPDVQRGLGTLLLLVKALGKETADTDET